MLPYHLRKCPAKYQGGSSQEMPSLNPTYINLGPDHCHPVKNPAYETV